MAQNNIELKAGFFETNKIILSFICDEMPRYLSKIFSVFQRLFDEYD